MASHSRPTADWKLQRIVDYLTLIVAYRSWGRLLPALPLSKEQYGQTLTQRHDCRAGRCAGSVQRSVKSEITHYIGQIGVTARRQDSGNLIAGHSATQPEESIGRAAGRIGKDSPRRWVYGRQLADDLSEAIHFVRKAFRMVVEFVAVAFAPFVAALRLARWWAKHRREMITFHHWIIARLPRWVHYARARLAKSLIDAIAATGHRLPAL